MMGLFDMLRAPVRAMDGDSAGVRSRDALDDFWYGGPRKPSVGGVDVSIEKARTVPVVRDCLQTLAQSTAQLGFGLFRKGPDDQRLALPNHPVARMMAQPNPRESSYEFIANLVDDLASAGKFLAERVPVAGGAEQLWRIAPNDFTPEMLADRSLRFKVREPGRPERTLLDDEVWYIALPPVKNYIHGRSPILDDGVEAIGAALAVQQYANSFFANDATPPFLFLHKGNFADEASKENFLSAWCKWFGGRNRGMPGVLEYGMEIKQMSHTNEASQFLETRKELWLDITRLWRIPPHKVGILDNATFSNIEHQGLEFVTDTLGPWLELIERSIARTFLTRADEYFEFNVSSLLRGDITARYAAYAVGRQWGWLSVNEIRRLENKNGIGRAGDRYIEPLNMTPVGEGQRDNPDASKAIAFLRQSVAANGGRPQLKVIQNVA
jgi:HK97 family phage portal protein